MNRVTRRDLLAAGAAGVGIATAGCTGSLGGNDDSDDSDGGGGDGGLDLGEETDDAEEGGDEKTDEDAADEDGADDEPADTDLPALQNVRVENQHDESHVAHVLVEDAGEIVHWSSHNVAANDAVTLDRTWTDARGEFVVSFRIDGQTSWTQVDLTEERPHCYDVGPRITEDASVKIWWMRNREGCGGTGADGSTSD